MGVKLIAINGNKMGMEVPVAGPRFFIGSARVCHLRLYGEPVSRHHCMIVVQDAFMAVRDMGSNGATRVNGKVVASEQELKVGDRIKVGALEFEIQLNVNADAKKKPNVHSVQEAATRAIEPIQDDNLDLGNWLNDTQIFNVIMPERHSSETTDAAVVEGLRRRSSSDKPEKKDK